jgi:hypothetical protein
MMKSILTKRSQILIKLDNRIKLRRAGGQRIIMFNLFHYEFSLTF